MCNLLALLGAHHILHVSRIRIKHLMYLCTYAVAYPGSLFGGRGGEFNSVDDRGQRERGSGGGSPLSGVLEAAVIWYKKLHFI